MLIPPQGMVGRKAGFLRSGMQRLIGIFLVAVVALLCFTMLARLGAMSADDQPSRSWQSYAVCVGLLSPDVVWFVLAQILASLPAEIALDTNHTSKRIPRTLACASACRQSLRKRAELSSPGATGFGTFLRKAVHQAKESLDSDRCYEAETSSFEDSWLKNINELQLEDVTVTSTGCGADGTAFEVSGHLQLVMHSKDPLILQGLVSNEVACFIEGVEVPAAHTTAAALYLGAAVWNVSTRAKFVMSVDECEVSALRVSEPGIDWDDIQFFDPSRDDGTGSGEATGALPTQQALSTHTPGTISLPSQDDNSTVLIMGAVAPAAPSPAAPSLPHGASRRLSEDDTHAVSLSESGFSGSIVINASDLFKQLQYGAASFAQGANEAASAAAEAADSAVQTAVADAVAESLNLFFASMMPVQLALAGCGGHSYDA